MKKQRNTPDATPRTPPQETEHLRRIVLGLFNPMPDGHAAGCLADDPHIHPRGPCICGYAEVAGEYLWALREARKLAAAHYGDREVEQSRRLKDPPPLVEAAATARNRPPA